MSEHDDQHPDLAIAERAFELTGNPLFAWVVVRHCVASGHPLPESIATYLVNVADTLVAQSQDRTMYSDVDSGVRDAVFGPAKNLDGGQGSHYTDFNRDWPRIRFTCDVAALTSGFDVASIMPGEEDQKVQTDSKIGAAILKCAEKYGLGEDLARAEYYKWIKLLAPKSKLI